MTSKTKIFNNLQTSLKCPDHLPEYTFVAQTYLNPVNVFTDRLITAGGSIHEMGSQKELSKIIAGIYPDCHKILTTNNDSDTSFLTVDKFNHAHDLEDVELVVTHAEFGVAENGAVWLQNQNLKFRALYFICQHLAILLNRKHIYSNMHDAYRQIDFKENGFGIFISGPSKTADIEQSLVIGAHGPRSCTILLY